jgi:hypothetical protein
MVNSILNKRFPIPGERWYLADGAQGYITILSVDSDPIDPWIEYQYNTGEIHEKNWFGFWARFYWKETIKD